MTSQKFTFLPWDILYIGIIFLREGNTSSLLSAIEDEGWKWPIEISSCIRHSFNAILRPLCDPSDIKFSVTVVFRRIKTIICSSCSVFFASQYSLETGCFFLPWGTTHSCMKTEFWSRGRENDNIETLLLQEEYDAVSGGVDTKFYHSVSKSTGVIPKVSSK
jgi:hypothetical protein